MSSTNRTEYGSSVVISSYSTQRVSGLNVFVVITMHNGSNISSFVFVFSCSLRPIHSFDTRDIKHRSLTPLSRLSSFFHPRIIPLKPLVAYRPSMDYPVNLPCGCIAGSLCLQQSLEQNPRCPLCHHPIRVTPGANAPSNPGLSHHLRQPELCSGLDDWPIPSIENHLEIPYGESTDEAARWNFDLRSKLETLNALHDTFLSPRELEVCVSLVDHRLGTATASADVLDAFFRCPLFDPLRWQRAAAIRASRLPLRDDMRVEDRPYAADLRDALVLVNRGAGTACSLNDVELVVSLMNHIHGTNVFLVDVLGLRGRGAGDGVGFLKGQVADRELVRSFGTLDLRVGGLNAIEDLGDVFSEAML